MFLFKLFSLSSRSRSKTTMGKDYHEYYFLREPGPEKREAFIALVGRCIETLRAFAPDSKFGIHGDAVGFLTPEHPPVRVRINGQVILQPADWWFPPVATELVVTRSPYNKPYGAKKDFIDFETAETFRECNKTEVLKLVTVVLAKLVFQDAFMVEPGTEWDSEREFRLLARVIRPLTSPCH